VPCAPTPGKEAAKQLAIKEDRERVANEGGSGVAAPAGRQDWRRWVDGVDWPDWRAWLQRVGSADLARGQWASAPWEQPPRTGEISLAVREYRPAEGAVRYHWPGQTWAQSLDTFDPDSIQIRLGTP
jgi:hypothetical protein